MLFAAVQALADRDAVLADAVADREERIDGLETTVGAEEDRIDDFEAETDDPRGENERLRADVTALESENGALRDRLAAFEERLVDLEDAAGTGGRLTRSRHRGDRSLLSTARLRTDMSEYPQAEGDVDSVAPAELADRLRNGEPVSVLDVRNRSEMEAWPLSGESVTTHHLPYYRFVEANVNDSVDDLAREVREALDEPILVVCGRGEASGYVAEQLSDEGVDAANLAEGMRGWARVYHAVELPLDAAHADDATVVQYQRPSSGCLAYLVVSGREAVVVDPLRAFAGRYVADAREHGAELTAAVDTHVHADHVSGVRELRERTGGDVAVVLPAGATERGLAFDARLVGSGDALEVGEVSLDAVALPGHTTEMLGFRLGDLLFAGDTVFLESVARPDLEVGDGGAPEMARQLHATLADIADDVRVAPAHFSDAARPDDRGAYVARMGDLRRRLRALSLPRDEFVDSLLAGMPPRPANYEEIIAVNLGRERADDEESFELELGPNNCAATTAGAD